MLLEIGNIVVFFPRLICLHFTYLHIGQLTISEKNIDRERKNPNLSDVFSLYRSKYTILSKIVATDEFVH